jgi:hypothetical protein
LIDNSIIVAADEAAARPHDEILRRSGRPPAAAALP